jgi:hypothetical protein
MEEAKNSSKGSREQNEIIIYKEALNEVVTQNDLLATQLKQAKARMEELEELVSVLKEKQLLDRETIKEQEEAILELAAALDSKTNGEFDRDLNAVTGQNDEERDLETERQEESSKRESEGVRQIEINGIG